MKRLERDDERRHRLFGSDTETEQVALEQLEVAELGGGKPRQRRFVLQRRSHPGVVGQPLESDQLGVREHSEQV
jgi:hypothetical protein